MSDLATLFRTEPHEPITLRAIRQRAIQNLLFTVQEFPDVEARWAALMEQALILNNEGYNIYTCLNPIKPEFRLSGTGGVKDADIVRRRLLLIDLDWTCNGFAPVACLIMPPWLRTRAG